MPEKKKNAVLLTLASGVSVELTEDDYFSRCVPRHYGLTLLNDDTRHIGLQNKELAEQGAPFVTNHTQTDQERADQLIQFFNDPEAKIGICPGGEGVGGALYWFDRYRQDPAAYIEQRKAKGSELDYFPPRPESDWIADNKILLVCSDTEELGIYCDASKIAYVVDAVPRVKAEKGWASAQHERSAAATAAIIDALCDGGECEVAGTLDYVVGKKLTQIVTQTVDVGSNRMMANQDRTRAGEFRRTKNPEEIIITELYDWFGVERLEMMKERLKKADVLVVNPDFVKKVGIEGLEKIAQAHPHLTIFQGDIAPSHEEVAMPCAYAQDMTINPDGSYSMSVQRQDGAERLGQNAEYHEFLKRTDIREIKAPKVSEGPDYSMAANEYIKRWSANDAVGLKGKDVTLTFPLCDEIHPYQYNFTSDNRDLTNLLVAGALEGIKSLTLQFPFETKHWWRDGIQKELKEDGKEGAAYRKFYEECPTYDHFVEKGLLFNDARSPVLARVRELRADYGINVRVFVNDKEIEIKERWTEKTKLPPEGRHTLL